MIEYLESIQDDIKRSINLMIKLYIGQKFSGYSSFLLSNESGLGHKRMRVAQMMTNF